MWTLEVHFWWGVQSARRGVFHSYWLNPLNAANSDPTSWKCGLVRGPHRCPKIPAQDTWCSAYLWLHRAKHLFTAENCTLQELALWKWRSRTMQKHIALRKILLLKDKFSSIYSNVLTPFLNSLIWNWIKIIKKISAIRKYFGLPIYPMKPSAGLSNLVKIIL
jgi:hypothetical protein